MARAEIRLARPDALTAAGALGADISSEAVGNRFLVVVVVAGLGAHCGPAGAARTVTPAYDLFTSRLTQLSADLNGDGRFDQWTYMDGNRPLRGEADTDGDGRIDRWEYFGPQASLLQVGTSSLNDGIEDTWTMPPSPSGDTTIARSKRRDRSIDRREIMRQGVLVSSEEDTDSDGRTDQWHVYENGVLREVRLDTTRTRGRADRRLVYGARGELLAIEQDDDGDGRFERLDGPAAGSRPTPGAGNR